MRRILVLSDPGFVIEAGERISKKAIYVDEEIYQRILKYSYDFKSPTHFIKHLLQLYERILSR